jgi:hypothetical protein
MTQVISPLTGQTAYLNSSKSQRKAEMSKEQLQKQFPDHEIRVFQGKDFPLSAFEEAPIYAVKAMVTEVLNGMKLEELDEDGRDEFKAEASKALTDLYKGRGFGKMFKQRKGIEGYTHDLLRPAADYINGYTGFITKLQLMNQLSEGLKGIPKKHLPGLYKYSLDYAKYNIGTANEHQNWKKLAYVYYLYMNISAASLNLTQSFILAWPELSKYTGHSMALLTQSLAEMAYESSVGKLTGKQSFITAEEWKRIDEFRDAGYIDPRQTMELSGATGNLVIRPINKKISKVLSFFDVFKHAEMLNREAMALALVRSGIYADTKVPATGGAMINGGQLIDNAHFMYGKANRPELMRGHMSPLMVFRSFGLHYLFWAKIQIDATLKKDGKAAGALARSAVALSFFGGFSAFAGAKWLAYLWRRIFGTEIEAEIIDALGWYGDMLWNGPFSTITGINFSQRVSPTQLPTPDDFDTWPEAVTSIGGVFADVPIRAGKLTSDLVAGDYRRALEDISPQAAKNILAGERLRTKGLRDRSGRPVMDYTDNNNFGNTPFKLSRGEATLKMFGWQPRRMERQWSLSEATMVAQQVRTARKQRWADRINLAQLDGDQERMDEVYADYERYNTKMARLGKTNDIIPFKELAGMILDRQNPNVPPEYMWDYFFNLRAKYYGEDVPPEQKNAVIDFWMKMAEEQE